MRFGPAIAIAIALCTALPTCAADFLGSHPWQVDKDWFGGLSGLEVSGDGLHLTAITDRGVLLTARIRRDAGRIAGIGAVRASRLRSSRGVPLIGRLRDSEGLALGPDGTICVSYEGVHRVACHDDPEAPARVLGRVPGFATLPGNKSLETLAMDVDGRLYTLPERAPDARGRIPVYRWDGARWSQPFSLPTDGAFLPVGADFGPDGRFYLLERDFGLFGFRSRLRRWSVEGDTPRAPMTLIETSSGTHDNLEGVSIWRDGQGTLRATMIADDNFLFFQQTEIVEYLLPD